MAKKTALFFAIPALTAVTTFAATQFFYKIQGTAELSIFKNEHGQSSIKTRTPKYQVAYKFDETVGQVPVAVIDQVVNQSYSLFAEGIDGDVSIHVWGGAQLKSLVWEKQEKATASSFEESLSGVVTTLAGCCDGHDTHRVYDLDSGKLLISYSEPGSGILPFVIEVPNSQLAPRMIGVITLNATRDTDFIAPKQGLTAAALVKYASRDGGYQKIQVDVASRPNYGVNTESELVVFGVNGDTKPEIRDGKATLWNADGARNPSQITGVAIKLTVNAGDMDMVVWIPVVNDRLDISKAVIPANVALQTIK